MSMVSIFKYTPKTLCASLSFFMVSGVSWTAYAQVSEAQISDLQAVEEQISEGEANAISDKIYVKQAMPIQTSDGRVDNWSEPLSQPELIEAPKVNIVPGYEGCEIVLVEPVADGASLASYRPADSFIESLYDDEEGYEEYVGELKVRAVMCTRSQVIPKLRDFPILASGVQFSISNDFDSSESQFMTVFYKGGDFQHKFSGPDLSEGEQIALRDVMEIFNLQSHDLDKKNTE